MNTSSTSIQLWDKNFPIVTLITAKKTFIIHSNTYTRDLVSHIQIAYFDIWAQ